jgi:hypothetical protein
MCPLSKHTSWSAGSQVGLHGSPFSLRNLVICNRPKLGCLHIWGGHPLCSHVRAAFFHRENKYEYFLAAMWSVFPGSSWICLDLPRSGDQNPAGWYSAAPAGGSPTRNAIPSPKNRVFGSRAAHREAYTQRYPSKKIYLKTMNQCESSDHLYPGLQTACLAGPSRGHTRLTGRGSTSRRELHVRNRNHQVTPTLVLLQYGK